MGLFGPNYGLVGKLYKHHTRPPDTVTVKIDGKGVRFHNQGKGVYRSDDGKQTYSYTKLFGDIPEKNNWPRN